MAVTYNDNNVTISHIYRATSGGTVFSANLAGNAVFDYFEDTAVNDDAIYFGSVGDTGRAIWNDLYLNIGTAIVATDYDIVWEYMDLRNGIYGEWTPMYRYEDDTQGFSVTGPQVLKFGVHEGAGGRTTALVNGVGNIYWIRARITNIDTLTEGGANQTTAPYGKNGRLNIEDYTDGSPCRLSTIYNYLNTNFPYLGCIWDGYHCDLTMVNLNVASRLLVTNESFEIGNRTTFTATYSGMNILSYLQMGYKVSDDVGRNGGVLRCHGGANQGNKFLIGSTSDIKIYNSKFITNGLGYPFLQGEWIGSTWDMRPRPVVDGIIRNCHIHNNGVWIMGTGWFGDFSGNTVYISGSDNFYLYDADIPIEKLTYSQAGTGRIFYLYRTKAPIDITVLNSSTLPTADNQVIRNANPDAGGTITSVLYNDVSAETFTDYTTEFADDTVDNAPIHGDVGDCYYFLQSLSPYNIDMEIATNLASNDYEYVWEYNRTGTWTEWGQHDVAENFTKNDIIQLWYQRGNSITPSNVVVNGVNGQWIRLRIVTKGTGTPHITKIHNFQNRCWGIGDWIIKQNFSLDIKVVDEDGVAIEGATVKIELGSTEEYSGTTDASGDMTQQVLTKKYWKTNPLINPVKNNNFYLYNVENGDRTITISKSGYETVKLDMDINQELTETFPLKKAIDVMPIIGGGMAIKADPTN